VTDFALLVTALSGGAFLHWAVMPRRHVPMFRAAMMRLRLRLKLHPGRGFACLPELWYAWGRFASFRESGRCRPGLPRWQLIISPAAHSVFLGRAQWRHGLRAPIQENWTVVGRSRSGKSGWLAKVILGFRGPCVCATTKPDLFTLTSGLRSLWWRPGLILFLLTRGVRSLSGRPVFTFNPQRLGDARARSTVRFDPVPGCDDPTVAIRRGAALTDAVRAKGTEDDSFWSDQAATMMPALLCAAALAGYDLRACNRWVRGDTRQAERILTRHGHQDWAATIAQLHGEASKTAATVRMVLVSALKFMTDPAIAECALPGPDGAFDIPRFLHQQGTLYLIADQRQGVSPVAPLFACLVNEIHWVACQLAGGMRGERLDPPLLVLLDEVTRICPIPAPALLADSGGRGITMITACQGLAQLEERWGKAAARSVLDTSNQAYLSGIADIDTLKMVSDLCCTATYRDRGGDRDKRVQVPVATPAMIRRLPKRRALILRGDATPVVTHLPMAWRDWRYRIAKLRGLAVARLQPVEALTPVDLPEPSWAALEPADVEAADSDLVASLAAGRGTVPAELVRAGASANGHLHGHANGHSNGHANGNHAPDAPGTRRPFPWSER